MSRPDGSDVKRVPGHVVINPTDLDADFPHGGAPLGAARDIMWRPNLEYWKIEAEEWGPQVCEVGVAGESAIFGCVLREFNYAAVSTLFPNVSAGGTGGSWVIEHQPAIDGQFRPGRLLSEKAVVLLFSPVAVDYDDHYLLYRALPMVGQSMEVELGPDREKAIVAVFQAIPDSQDRVYKVGLREDLTL